jgi:hypothetical protein
MSFFEHNAIKYLENYLPREVKLSPTEALVTTELQALHDINVVPK